MDVLEEYLKIEKLDPTQVPDAAVKHKEESFVKMTNEFSVVENSGKQFIKDATDVRTQFVITNCVIVSQNRDYRTRRSSELVSSFTAFPCRSLVLNPLTPTVVIWVQL